MKLHFPADRITRWLIALIAGTILTAMAGLWIYNRVHLFDSFEVIQSTEDKDTEGTRYAMLGGHVVKYGHDGLFCTDGENSPLWSISYSMQSPVYDICEDVMVIAEQQGRQVYVIDKDGLLGSFSTSLNIKAARAAASGVAALILEDDDVVWINLYNKDGSQIVSVRTTLEDSGYPLDIALSSDGRRMAVSFLSEEEGCLTGKIAFYDFSSSSEERHLVQTVSYANTVFPDVFYADGRTPVAVGDNCFIVFDRAKKPSQSVKVDFEKEIVSCFYDDDNIGFLFHSDAADMRYDMDVYGFSGKRTMQAACDFEYSGVSMAGGEILLYDTANLHVYRASGRPKLDVSYGKEVRYFAQAKGLRKYLVITEDSMDQIRIS